MSTTQSTCPACNGSGEVTASILFAEEIETNLTFLLEDRKVKNMTLIVHPYIASYFTKGIMSKQMKWFLKYKKWIPVRGSTANHLLEYSFVNKKNEVITL
ncbi:MAG: hypothetical protein ACPGU5_07405 [Lishizhenia sp.]